MNDLKKTFESSLNKVYYNIFIFTSLNLKQIHRKKVVLSSIVSLFFCGISTAQALIDGDVYIASKAVVGVFYPELTFRYGIIESSEENSGRLAFFPNAHGLAAHDGSHAEATVLSHEHPDFVFPVGDKGVYQPMRISSGDTDDLAVAFKLESHLNTAPSLEINQISNRFYWTVEGTKQAKMTLSWNLYSELNMLTDELAALVMIGYTGTEWEVIPSVIDPFTLEGDNPTTLSAGAISSVDRIDFSRFEAVTLGSILLDIELSVSEGITPNGDGINDTWYIKNIERYPNAQIWVFNIWGAEVFHQPGNYNNNWDATYKNNTKKLPSAPYYYRIVLREHIHYS